MILFPRRMLSVFAAVAITTTPIILVASARLSFGGWSPLHGTGPVRGWVWRAVAALGEPIDASALADVVIRAGLVIGWLAVLAVMVAIPGELSAIRSGIAFRSGPAARLARIVIGGFLVVAQPVSGVILAADAADIVEAEPDQDVLPVDVWTVTMGDSVYGIAEHLVGGDSSRVFEIAEGILELNLGTEMVDGSLFTNPATIRPGWRLALPAVGETTETDALSATHRVSAGDTLASIAKDHLGSADLWPEIFEINNGREMPDGRVVDSPDVIMPGWVLNLPVEGERELPAHIVDEIENWRPEPERRVVAAPALDSAPATIPETVPTSVSTAESPIIDATRADGRWVELAGATMLAAGVVGALATRRRRGLRRVRTGQHPRARTPELVEVERTVMAGAANLAALDRMVAVDLAVRSILPVLVQHEATIRWLSVDGRGVVRVAPDGRVVLPGPWSEVSDMVWELAEVPSVSDGIFPCPTLVEIGVDALGADLFVDLEMVNGVAVEGEGNTEVVAALASALSMSPFAQRCSVLDASLRDPAGADESATPWVERILLDEPADPIVFHDESSLLPSTAPPDSVPLVIRLEPGGLAAIHEWGVSVRPLRLGAHEIQEIAELTADPVLEPDEDSSDDGPEVMPCPPILVRVLGDPCIESADGVPIEFERSKSLELIVWMATHRERPTRSRARAALWDTEVRSATFSNVVSDARRSLARAVPPGDAEEWVDRTMTEELVLHPDVLTDADVLRSARDRARPLPPESAVEVLRPALELVRGLPFSGTVYLWPDPEGITSDLVVLATGAAAELASWYLALGDLDGVFWATSRGLQVLPGHEELIALRMRARAARGDTAGLRQEWASYERVLADEWSGGEPAPELVQLRRELLSARASASAST